MKTVSDMPINLLLGLFYFGLAYSILSSHNSQIGAYLFSTFGWSNEIASNLIAIVLGAAGVYMWIGNITSNGFKIAGFPMMAYLGLSVAANVASRTAFGGQEMIALLAVFLLYRDFNADAKRQSLETLLNRTVAEANILRNEVNKKQE